MARQFSSGFKFAVAVLGFIGLMVIAATSGEPDLLVWLFLGIPLFIALVAFAVKVWNMAEYTKQHLAESKRQTEMLASIVAKLHERGNTQQTP
jgi:hypothetical protein